MKDTSFKIMKVFSNVFRIHQLLALLKNSNIVLIKLISFACHVLQNAMAVN